MFAKENSSTTTKGAKKSKDVPLKKSDRRRLLKTAEEWLLVNSNAVVENAVDTDTIDERRTKQILRMAFLQGQLNSRILHMSTGDKVTCFFRYPSQDNSNEASNDNDNDNNDKDDALTEFFWPYTRSSECIWMQVQRGANQEPWQVPSLALLAVLAHVAEAADTMDTFHSRVPIVMVPPQVARFLCRGADLMKAGMRSLPATQDLARTAGIVAVCIHGNPQPVAIGHLHESLLPRNQSEQAQIAGSIGVGCKGVGVSIISSYGDDLWKQQMPIGNLKSNPESPATSLFDTGHYGNPGFLEGTEVVPIVEGLESGSEEEEEGENAAEIPSGATTSDAEDSVVDATATPSDEPPAALQQPPEPEPLDPDEVLHAAVCKALVSIRPKQDLPMTVAHFYAQYVLPSRPSGTTIELKKTVYKKLGSYIKEQVNDGLIVVGPDKSKKDPMAMLVDYNRRHPDLYEFIQEHKANPEAAASNSNTPRKLVLLQLYCVPNHFVALMRLDPDVVKAADATSTERRGTGMLTQKEMRSILDEYVAKEALIHPTRPDQIQLNGPLTDALYKKKKQGGLTGAAGGAAASPAPAVLSRKDVVALWQTKMEAAFCLVETPGNRIVQLGRGKAPTVQVEVVMRQSKKFITRVRGLEAFGIDPVQFSKDVAHRFACSASVDDEADGRAALRKGHAELVFQGNLADEMEALLLSDESLTSHGGAKGSDYYLPKNSIEVTLRKGVPPRKRKGPTAKKK
jgi:translation initiation factor 2D